MEENSKADFSFSSTNLILYLYSKRKPLILIASFAAIVSVIISLTIAPRYRSTVIMFPASGVSISQALVSTTTDNQKSGILSFGEEEEVEQLLQILHSEEIKQKLVQKYNLFEHYDIKEDVKYKYTLLNARMKKNISFRKTEYMSVNISVLDEDPQIAADMANEIAALLDSTMNRMQKERAEKAFQIVSNEYLLLQSEIKEIEDSLTSLGELGIYDVEAQSVGLNEAWLSALSEDNMSLANKLEYQIEILGIYGGNYIFLKKFLEDESRRLSLLKDKYTRAKVDTEQSLPHTFIVDRAEKAEKKAYPKKSLIVLLSVFSSLIFGIFGLIFIDTFKNQV
ncbi:MAG: hypothetical protein U9N53_13020 [Bacteroidota bacterium]|nr:hypothetical protein [Bacteroidota bacterium]